MEIKIVLTPAFEHRNKSKYTKITAPNSVKIDSFYFII